eukprot:s2802_g9.t1
MGSKVSAARGAGDDFEEWIRRDLRVPLQKAWFILLSSAARISLPKSGKMAPAREFSSSSDESLEEETEAPAAAPKSAANPPAAPPDSSSQDSDSRDESMEAAVGSPVRKGSGDMEPTWRPPPEQDGRGKGWHKGSKGRKIKCQFCWRPLSHPSGCDQHQWHNLHCLTWQYYLRGGCTWREAEDRAAHTKAARENYEPESEHPDARGSGIRRSAPPLPDPTPPPPPPARTHRRRAEGSKATCEVRLVDAPKRKKEKKDKKEKKPKKGKRVVTPSPSPPRRRHGKRDPPSDPEDDRKSRKVPKVTQVDEKTWVVKIR